jgi:apolipoprotein N-acyltransferase
LGTEGVLDSVLPRPLPPPPYARFGDAPAAIMVGVCFIAVLRMRRRSRLKKSRT